MSPRRPTPIKSDLSAGPAAVIAPPQAANSGNAGNASDTDERIVKVTARVGENLAGRCRAAYIDGVLKGGSTSFEGWIAEAMASALARAEEERGKAYEPLGSDRIPKGHR